VDEVSVTLRPFDRDLAPERSIQLEFAGAYDTGGVYEPEPGIWRANVFDNMDCPGCPCEPGSRVGDEYGHWRTWWAAASARERDGDSDLFADKDGFMRPD
jgi:hypothetical protein